MFGSKNYLVSVLFVWVVFTVVQCVPVANDDPAPSPTLNRQKRTFFSSWWPYTSTEDITPPVQPFLRVIVTGQTNSSVVDAWNNQHATEIIGELEAAKNRLDETLQKLKNLSIKKFYDSDESNEDDSGERQPRPETKTTTRPPLRPYTIKYVLRKTTSTTTPPAVKVRPVQPATTTSPAAVEVLPVEPATTTTPAAVEVLPVEPATTTTPAAVQVLPVEPTTTPADVEVRPVQPATTTPAAVEVLPVEPTTTTPAAVEIRPVQPATTTTASNHTNEDVQPQQQVTTTETEDVQIQPDQPATKTTAEDSLNRIRPQTTTSTVSDDNAEVKTEAQQQATTASAATVEDSVNTAVENVQPAQPATAENDSSSTTEPEVSVEPRYAAESVSLENSKNNKKKVSWDYYLKKRVPLNEKMSSKIGAQYTRELQADR